VSNALLQARASFLLAVGQPLVPGLHVHLTDDLAVTQLQRLGAQNARPIRVLAHLVERYAVLSYDLVLDAVDHLPCAYLTQVLGDFFLAPEHVGRTGGGVAINGLQLGILSVAAHERIGVALLDAPAQNFEE
jgi:hypothetical protein